MNITLLKIKLFENKKAIIELLEYYKFYGIQASSKEIRCARDKFGGKTAIKITLNKNLTSVDFARNVEGDIFSIICSTKDVSLYEVVQKSKTILGITTDIPKIEKKVAFGGFFDKFKKGVKEEVELKTYSEDILLEYDNGYNLRFLRDGISLETQKKFNIGYCNYTDRITVPWRDLQGSIIGIMGRYNGNNKDISKWFPIISFPKSKSLYGYSENYCHIVENETIYIGESEKFVLQLSTIAYYNCVSLGGNNITDYQAKAIIKTFPKRIIFCYDEGLDLSIIINQCLKVKKLAELLNIKVGYIYDRNNDILPLNSKDSPSDLGKQKFERLVTDYVQWV